MVDVYYESAAKSSYGACPRDLVAYYCEFENVRDQQRVGVSIWLLRSRSTPVSLSSLSADGRRMFNDLQLSNVHAQLNING